MFNSHDLKFEIRKRKADWIGHILRRNRLLKQDIEGKIKGKVEVTRRRGRWRKKLLDDVKYRRGYSHLKEEALDRTMWRNRFGRGFGPVVKQITEWWRFQIRVKFDCNVSLSMSVFYDVKLHRRLCCVKGYNSKSLRRCNICVNFLNL